MPWARASALDRHLECPAASHLPIWDRGAWHRGYLQKGILAQPDLKVEPEDRTAANWGLAMHSAKAGEPDATDPWLTWVDPHRDRLWPPRLGLHEVSVSYDCRTRAVELFLSPEDAARSAWKMSRGDDCVVGTCDWWGDLPGTGEPWVDDLKTGWRKPELPSAQVLFYLLCRMQFGSGPEARTSPLGPDVRPHSTGRVSITHWPRAKEPTEPSRDGLWRQISEVALSAFAEEIHHAWMRAVGWDPSPRPGSHCLYCPSALVCDRSNS